MARSSRDIAAHHLAAIVESSDDAIVSKDVNGIIMSWNRAAERIFGYSSDEAVGRSIHLIIPDDRRSEEDHVLSQIRAGHSVEHFETVRQRKDGTRLHVSLTVSPIRDSAGVVIGASKIARDITERKRVEAAVAELDHRLLEQQRALRESAERGKERAAFLAEVARTLSASLEYEKTLPSVASLAVPRIADWCAVDIIAEDGQLQRLAVAHADSEKVLLGRMLADRYPEDAANPGWVHSVLTSGQPVILENIPDSFIETAAQDDEHLRLLRGLKLCSYLSVPMMTDSRPFGVLTFIMAESSRHYGAEDVGLAQEVAALASLAVQNARAYQRASEANRLKDQFLATLSHELRTPLSAILGYTRLLRLGKLGEEQQGPALDVVERNALSLKQIIEDVLDVSRIAAGKLRLNVQPVRLPEIIEDAVTTVLPAADAKGVLIETTAERRPTLVSGDPERLQQVVWNVLSNAVKFTPRGGRVKVRVESVDSQAEIVVTDTGQGVDPDFLPHMFERFRQEDSGFSRQQGGLGLGLAIVRELVEMHGGTVRAESDGPGSGTTVRVRLPLLSLQQAAVESSAVAPGPVSRLAPDPPPAAIVALQGVRVLVVDDEEDAVALLAHILEAAGATVTTARSAGEALARLQIEVPDVLVSDVGMPGMDGLDLIRRLRQSPVVALRTLPALALTAYARMEDRLTALSSGFHMHLAKPADPSELALAVASLARPASRLKSA